MAIRQIFSHNAPIKIDYTIGDIGGQSLGSGGLRSHYRGILNRVYFNKKYDEILNNSELSLRTR